ncbi:putative pentatricopeptide repeat-containing protein At1g10330 [Pyrus communis]|uniref:putative pentatricopeptide repeat-containing protein At1g10330 n=1 Tax=Pyrus communis TaxID=23211 RepID=UPI0035C0390C
MAAVMAAAMVCQPTEEQPQWGGSIAGHSYKPLNKAMSHVNLMNNYFNANSVYTEEDFKRRFRMRCHVFECLLHDVQQVNPYFPQKLDRASCPSFSPHQKVTVALRMMAYGSPADLMDKTHGMSKSTCLDTIQQLCDTIDEYLGGPNQEDLNRLLCKAEDCGFPGMIGSLDCMHWDWKNCPTGWQEGFSGRDVVSWTSVINGFGRNGCFSKGIRFFQMMMNHENVMGYFVKPNEATYVSVLSSCANLGG